MTSHRESKGHPSSLEAWRLIREIRRQEEPSRFGYRLQGLFVHTLSSIGARVMANRAQGHPDVDCRYGGRHVKFEVEVLSSLQLIEPAKVNAIAPEHPGSEGFLALFDANYPLRWIVIDHARTLPYAGHCVKRHQLEALKHSPLSEALSDQFIELVLRNKNRLRNLGFGLLSRWAERGDVI